MNVRDIINDVLQQSGFLPLSQVFGASDPDSRQMGAIANRALAEIRDFYMWPELRRDFSVIFQTSQTRYPLPDDYWQMVPESVWELNGARQAEWPTPNNRWYMYKFSGWSTGGTIRIRPDSSNTIEVRQPLDGQTVSFAYITKYAVQAEDLERKERFTRDTDTFLLNDGLLGLGIQAHWAETKLLPQAGQWMANYMRKMNEAISIATGAKVIGRGTIEGRGAPYYPLWRP